MKYVINLATKTVHIDSCCKVRDFAKKDDTTWHKFKDLNEVKKFCKKDGRKFKFCKICQPNLKGKEVR